MAADAARGLAWIFPGDCSDGWDCQVLRSLARLTRAQPGLEAMLTAPLMSARNLCARLTGTAPRATVAPYWVPRYRCTAAALPAPAVAAKYDLDRKVGSRGRGCGHSARSTRKVYPLHRFAIRDAESCGGAFTSMCA
jgi:hypothetical protein